MASISHLKEYYYSYLEYKPKSIFHEFFSEFILFLFSWIPTLIGVSLRTVFYKLIFKKCGFVSIRNNVEFKDTYNISLGNLVTIKKHAYLNGNSKEGLIIGDNSFIDHYAYIKCQGVSGITIGKSVYVGPFAQIISVGPIVIEDNVMVSGQCFVISGDHPTEGEGDVSKNVKKMDGITIGKGSWIGADVKIVDGVKIGKGVVIGAGAVVTKDIPDNSIAVGVPAKVIKKRK